MTVGYVVQATNDGRWITYTQWRTREQAMEQARALQRDHPRVRVLRVDWTTEFEEGAT